jgi:hypothetical protein
MPGVALGWGLKGATPGKLFATRKGMDVNRDRVRAQIRQEKEK